MDTSHNHLPEFLHACAHGETNNFPTLCHKVTELEFHRGMGMMIEHKQTEKLFPVLQTFISRKIFLTIVSQMLHRSDFEALNFVFERVDGPQLALDSFCWLSHSGKNHSESVRKDTAVFLARKLDADFYTQALNLVVDKGDAILTPVLCANSPQPLSVLAADNSIDLFPFLLLCSNAINWWINDPKTILLSDAMKYWNNDPSLDEHSKEEYQRYTDVLYALLQYVDHNELQQRLYTESARNPDTIENSSVLAQWIEQKHVQVLTNAVDEMHRDSRIQNKHKI